MLNGSYPKRSVSLRHMKGGKTDMKEKYTKPEINVMMSIIIGDDDKFTMNDEEDNGVMFFGNNDISGGTVPGQGGSDL